MKEYVVSLNGDIDYDGSDMEDPDMGELEGSIEYYLNPDTNETEVDFGICTWEFKATVQAENEETAVAMALEKLKSADKGDLPEENFSYNDVCYTIESTKLVREFHEIEI